MVTDSQWVDIDADGLLDLIMVGDWMPITVLKNKGKAKFENITYNLGLEKSHGMWNTLSVHDFDGDGRLDIIAGNTVRILNGNQPQKNLCICTSMILMRTTNWIPSFFMNFSVICAFCFQRQACSANAVH